TRHRLLSSLLLTSIHSTNIFSYSYRDLQALHSFPTRRSSDLLDGRASGAGRDAAAGDGAGLKFSAVGRSRALGYTDPTYHSDGAPCPESCHFPARARRRPKVHRPSIQSKRSSASCAPDAWSSSSTTRTARTRATSSWRPSTPPPRRSRS